MSPSVWIAGNRVHTRDATYTLPDPATAQQVLESFMTAERGEDLVKVALRRYNAHLEALLAGGRVEALTPVDRIDPRIAEIPKRSVRQR